MAQPPKKLSKKKLSRWRNSRICAWFFYYGVDELVFDFFAFFGYMQVWWLFTITFFDFFEYMQVLCTFGIKLLIFFEYMQGW